MIDGQGMMSSYSYNHNCRPETGLKPVKLCPNRFFGHLLEFASKIPDEKTTYKKSIMEVPVISQWWIIHIKLTSNFHEKSEHFNFVLNNFWYLSRFCRLPDRVCLWGFRFLNLYSTKTCLKSKKNRLHWVGLNFYTHLIIADQARVEIRSGRIWKL